MTVIDGANVFFGETRDGHIFATASNGRQDLQLGLLAAGFRPNMQYGRTVYLLPEQATTDDSWRAIDRACKLLAPYTGEIVILANPEPAADADLRVQLDGDRVTATAATAVIQEALQIFGFSAVAAAGQDVYTLPAGMASRHKTEALLVAVCTAHAYGQRVHVDLGIPTRDDIGKPTPAPARAAEATPPRHATTQSNSPSPAAPPAAQPASPGRTPSR